MIALRAPQYANDWSRRRRAAAPPPRRPAFRRQPLTSRPPGVGATTRNNDDDEEEDGDEDEDEDDDEDDDDDDDAIVKDVLLAQLGALGNRRCGSRTSRPPAHDPDPREAPWAKSSACSTTSDTADSWRSGGYL